MHPQTTPELTSTWTADQGFSVFSHIGSVLESKATVKSVPRRKRLHFYWTHKFIEGNEIVDEIAKSEMRLSPENVISTGKPLYDYLNRSMQGKSKCERSTWVQNCKSYV